MQTLTSIHISVDRSPMTEERFEPMGEPFTDETLELTCDLCGTISNARLLKIIPGPAQLCDHCYRQFLTVPEGPPHQCLARYLLGNVV